MDKKPVSTVRRFHCKFKIVLENVTFSLFIFLSRQMTEFQSRLLVAAAVQASVGSHTHSSVGTLTPCEAFYYSLGLLSAYMQLLQVVTFEPPCKKGHHLNNCTCSEEEGRG